MLLHVVDAVPKGIKKVAIRTVDKYIVVLTVASFSNINPDEADQKGSHTHCGY